MFSKFFIDRPRFAGVISVVLVLLGLLAIAVLPDHPTPCELRTHTAEPVPFLIYYPGIKPDGVQTFDEKACKDGVYGVMKENEFMNEFMKL